MTGILYFDGILATEFSTVWKGDNTIDQMDTIFLDEENNQAMIDQMPILSFCEGSIEIFLYF